MKQKAAYGDQKARADALTIKFEYQKRKAEAFAKLIELRNLLPRVKAETEKLESDVAIKRKGLAMARDLQRGGAGSMIFGR